ncbi:putative cofactor assembly of complex C subunit B, CCB2/CCB4 [Helianthus debilis subsp. tardiflorus]
MGSQVQPETDPNLFRLNQNPYISCFVHVVFSDSELWEMLPEGTRSVLVLPVNKNGDEDENSKDKSAGFVLLASSINYAYSNKDRAWIAAIAKKF